MMPDAEQRGIPANPLSSARAPRELLTAIWDQSSDPASPWPLSQSELEELFRDAHSRGPGSGIDPERLAGLMAGILSEEQRQEALELLSTDETAYQQFLALARFRALRDRDRSASASPASPVSPIRPRRSSLGKWTALAAAASILLAFGLYWVIHAARPLTPDSLELAAALERGSALPVVGFELPVDIDRGANDPAAPEALAARFELGVRSFDLALAVQAGNREEAALRLEQIPSLLDTALGVADVEAAPYVEIGERIATTPEIRTLAEDIAAAERSLAAVVDWPEMSFGRWVEASRFAARLQSRSFFASPELYLHPLRRFRAADPSTEVTARLAALPDRKGAELRFADIEADLVGILQHCLAGRPCLGET